jgi:TPR repeat protein
LFKHEQAERRRRHLEAAAEAGFAQACDTLGGDYQHPMAVFHQKPDLEKAYAWYERAGRSGLGVALRNQSFFLANGLSADKDEKRALEIALRGAEAGDAMAMINAAMFFRDGTGTQKDVGLARHWIDRAAATGHWAGFLEKGFALQVGAYGYETNRTAGVAEWQKALGTRNCEVLEMLSAFYANGAVGEPDRKTAVKLAEAAFIQGSGRAAMRLATIYEDGGAGVAPDKELADFWNVQSMPSIADTLAAENKNSPVAKRLATHDPWSVELPK